MRVLLSAFEPYDQWTTNSSWLALVDLLRERPANGSLVTRRYPVDFERMRSALYKDLSQGFDAVLHLGQAPGSTAIRLEAVAINAGGSISQGGQVLDQLVPEGPEAYRTQMPLDRWCARLREQSIPTQISYHAGTYLCNAIMYLSHHWVAHSERSIPVGFIHLPLSLQQATEKPSQALPCLPVSTMSQALGLILDDLCAIEAT